MKREVAFHEVTVRFSVRADSVANTISGYPHCKDWLKEKFGKRIDPDDYPFDSEQRRSAVAIVVRQGIGGNDMNTLDAEGITVEVDGAVMIDEA